MNTTNNKLTFLHICCSVRDHPPDTVLDAKFVKNVQQFLGKIVGAVALIELTTR